MKQLSKLSLVDMGNSVTPDKETYNSKFNDLGTSVKNNASF